MDSDNLLVEKTIGGDISSFEELVKKYFPKLQGFFIKMGLSSHDAQDSAQDTLIKAYEKLDKYSSGWAFSTWLYSIASNTFKDFLRRNRQIDFTLDEAIDHADGRDTLDRFIMAQDIKRLLGTLKPDVRSMLLLHYYCGLSFAEVARIYHTSPDAVKMKIARARAKLLILANDQ